ncbi:MAG: winged helix-turn-helix transcriptional regulator [Pseudomonadota bacterium]
MVRRRSLKGDYCPSARALDVIGDWWSLLIVRDAFDGLARFSEFQKSLGIAKNILSDRLRALVERGILRTAAAADGGAHLEYHLTDRGRDLFPVMVALRQWGERHLFAPGEKHSQLIERGTGKAVRLHIRTEDGRPIDADQAVILKVPEGK